jgi:hypothetical protein
LQLISENKTKNEHKHEVDTKMQSLRTKSMPLLINGGDLTQKKGKSKPMH